MEESKAIKLLKAATKDIKLINQQGRCAVCKHSIHNATGLIGKCRACYNYSQWEWRHEAEALKLIEGEKK